ncbi:MAG: hypothetical protein ABW167_19665, partial [Baekduia sp.]
MTVLDSLRSRSLTRSEKIWAAVVAVIVLGLGFSQVDTYRQIDNVQGDVTTIKERVTTVERIVAGPPGPAGAPGETKTVTVTVPARPTPARV